MLSCQCDFRFKSTEDVLLPEKIVPTERDVRTPCSEQNFMLHSAWVNSNVLHLQPCEILMIAGRASLDSLTVLNSAGP